MNQFSYDSLYLNRCYLHKVFALVYNFPGAVTFFMRLLFYMLGDAAQASDGFKLLQNIIC